MFEPNFLEIRTLTSTMLSASRDDIDHQVLQELKDAGIQPYS